MKLLVVEDEQDLRNEISTFLISQKYQCDTAFNFFEGEDKIALYEYELVILDIGLPDGSGLDLLKMLKTKNQKTLIIILSAKNSMDDKLAGLDLGADDYLTKPFNMAELNARIYALIRRNLHQGEAFLTFGEIQLNPKSHEVHAGKIKLELTNREYQLLEYFMINPKRMLSKQDLTEHLLGEGADLIDNFDFLYVHLKNLRKKLKLAMGIDYIQTIYGLGYKLQIP